MRRAYRAGVRWQIFARTALTWTRLMRSALLGWTSACARTVVTALVIRGFGIVDIDDGIGGLRILLRGDRLALGALGPFAAFGPVTAFPTFTLLGSFATFTAIAVLAAATAAAAFLARLLLCIFLARSAGYRGSTER
jgi:hypothetical protein